MLHQIPVRDLGPRGDAMAKAVTSCVHCGFCLPSCPTYEVLGEEADSPRGRIFLMKEVLEGNLDAKDAAVHIDRCLGCVACETSCPSGVNYGDLLSSYRSSHQVPAARGLWARFRRAVAKSTVPYPRRFRLAMRLGRIFRPPLWLVPRGLRPLVQLLPDELPRCEPPGEMSPAVGEAKGTVAIHLGCAAQVLNPDITASAIRVLNRCGYAVRAPQSQQCCGSLHWHTGDDAKAKQLARRNIAAFATGGDEPIVTTAAGCGSGMHEYPLMLAGESDAAAASEFSGRIRDVSVLLAGIELPPMRVDQPLRIAYHDACHLLHAQRVRRPPRELLQRIEGVTLVEPADPDYCCGSAGTYNIDQPEIADQLGRRKAESLIRTGCDLVALGNIGCQVQIEQYLREAGSTVPVLHVVQVLDRVLRGEAGSLTRPRSPSP